MKKDTFENLWTNILSAKAASAGVSDGDLDEVRSSVKSALVSAGWVESSGACSFLSNTDKGNCLTAAAEQIQRVAPNLVNNRKVTRMQVMSASATTDFAPNNAVSASLPGMAKVGDRCSKCSGTMDVVGLVNDRAGLYCSRDRVVLPLPSGTSLKP